MVNWLIDFVKLWEQAYPEELQDAKEKSFVSILTFSGIVIAFASYYEINIAINLFFALSILTIATIPPYYAWEYNYRKEISDPTRDEFNESSNTEAEDDDDRQVAKEAE